MSAHTDLERIFNTLHLFDPDGRSICVGGAAITLALASVGIENPRSLDDVDVLVSADDFARLASIYLKPELPPNIYKTQIRRPGGRLLERGASNMALDIYPTISAKESHGLTAFTACISMSDSVYPIDYDGCQQGNRHTISEYVGVRALALGEVLEWIAVIGREKDIDTVGATLPLAIRSDLVSENERKNIEREYRKSVAIRTKHPDRHAARRS